ncbi:hypothetical protein PFISCL1PPCAC_6154, partial [Pristionchus fissidentatus]
QMFPSSRAFEDLMCPHEASCGRVYCPFWHPPEDSTVIVERLNNGLVPSSEYADGSYNGSFYGYNAYVADSSSNSIYAPEIPMEPMDQPSTSSSFCIRFHVKRVIAVAMEDSMVEREIKQEVDEDEIEIIGEKTVKPKKKSIRELPLPKVAPAKNKNKLLDEYMSKVSELNRKIEELQQEAEPKKKEKKVAKKGYVPTPLSDLEKRKKEKKEEERKRKEDDERKERRRKKMEDEEKEKKKKEDKSESMLIDALFEDFQPEPAMKKRREERPMPVREEKKELTAAQIAAAKGRVARPAASALARQTIAPKKNISAAQQVQRRIESAAEKERLKELEVKEGVKQQQRALTEGEKIAQLTTGRTNASSVAKGDSRKAHTDKASSSRMEKPQLRDAGDTKIPMNVRLSFLDKFFTHFLKSTTTRATAIENAEVEEKAVKDKTSSKNGYTVAAVNALKRLRDESATRSNGAANKPIKMSHSAMLAGRMGSEISVGVKRNNGMIERKLSGGEKELRLHEVLDRYVLTEEELVSNGYPRWETDDKLKVSIELHEMDKQRGKKSFVEDSDLRRQCSRCTIEFTVRKDGQPVPAGCTYHHSRMMKKRVRGEGWASVYGCCDSDLTTKGCTYADTHVFDTLRVSDLEAFVESPGPWGELDPRSKKVYAMDCEMVYTTWGPALARVSVVDMNDDLVLDLLVRPSHKLIDANSRFSGLQPEQVEGAESTLEEAREKLFELVNSETLLIGHSLESDLKAMRIVHHRVVDTSVVFPHRCGPPLKRALRNLAGEILLKIIQEDVSGHDSKEDSSACMQLMLYKLKQDGVHL